MLESSYSIPEFEGGKDMVHLIKVANHRFAMGFIALIFAAHTQAALMDCAAVPATNIPVAGECQQAGLAHVPVLVTGIPATTVTPVTTASGFQLNPPRALGSLPDSAPLIVLFATLIAIFLVKAKSINTK